MAQTPILSLPEFHNVSTGSLVVKEAMNFWGGVRVQGKDKKNSEPVYEPATGKYVAFSHVLQRIINLQQPFCIMKCFLQLTSCWSLALRLLRKL